MSLFHFMSAVEGLMIVPGLFYAIFGTATISVNGRTVPGWASAMLRLVAPVPMLLMTLASHASAPQHQEN